MLARLSPYWLWLLLSVPFLGMISPLLGDDARAFHGVLHPSGEFAARFMIIGMMATPLVLLFRGWRGPRWLVKNRRYFGVAAFGYAAVHTLVYVIGEGSLDRILAEATKFEIWTGWLAFAIFIPLAATSMDYMMRLLGPAWKPLQTLDLRGGGADAAALGEPAQLGRLGACGGAIRAAGGAEPVPAVVELPAAARGAGGLKRNWPAGVAGQVQGSRHRASR